MVRRCPLCLMTFYVRGPLMAVGISAIPSSQEEHLRRPVECEMECGSFQLCLIQEPQKCWDPSSLEPLWTS